MNKVIYHKSKEDFLKFKEKNLALRHLIAELMPELIEADAEKYRNLFKFSEKLEKRILIK